MKSSKPLSFRGCGGGGGGGGGGDGNVGCCRVGGEGLDDDGGGGGGDCEVERERKPSLTCKLKLTFLNCKHRKNPAVKPMTKNTKNAKTFTSFNETLKGFNVGKAKLSLCCFIMGRREKKKQIFPFLMQI